jgi:hypothetical protein
MVSPPFDGFSPSDVLERLVTILSERTKERVAILVDEFDSPIRDVVNDLELAEIHRQVLHNFYSAIKALADRNMIHLIYITGETKFTQTSVFSVFNNLIDLTLNPDFNAACGFTLEEFETYFTQYLPLVLKYNQSKGFMSNEVSLENLKNEIIDYYDGYSWDGENRILNPSSLIKMLDCKEFIYHLFATATPTFLTQFLEREGKRFDFQTNPAINRDCLNVVDLKNIELTTLMFQTVYLTIDKKLNTNEVLLRLPNKEVNYAFEKRILNFLRSR